MVDVFKTKVVLSLVKPLIKALVFFDLFNSASYLVVLFERVFIDDDIKQNICI